MKTTHRIHTTLDEFQTLLRDKVCATCGEPASVHYKGIFLCGSIECLLEFDSGGTCPQCSGPIDTTQSCTILTGENPRVIACHKCTIKNQE